MALDRASVPDEGSLLDDLPVAAIVMQDGAAVYMNRRAGELTGCGPGELPGLRIVVHGAGADLSWTLGEWSRRLPAARSTRSVVRARPRRGLARTLEIRSRPSVFAGAPATVLAAVDITEQERAGGELRLRADLYGDVLTSLPIGVAVVDASGVVVAINDAWNEIGGGLAPALCRPRLSIGSDYLAACRRASQEGCGDAREMLLGVGAVLGGSMPHFDREQEAAGGDGEARWFVTVATPLRGGRGAVITQSDVTSLRRRERAAAERAAHERGLLANLPDELVRMTAAGDVVEARAPTSKSPMVSPISPGRAGQNVLDLLPPAAAESLLDAIRGATQADRIAMCTFTVSQDDDARSYEARVVPVSPREALVFARDRTADQWAITRAPDGDDTRLLRARLAREMPYGLTFREVTVLELMAHGASDKQIASTLGVSVFTVNKHVSKILHKMGASSRTEASTRTLREGLFG